MRDDAGLKAADVMTVHVVSIPPATGLDAIAHVMRDQSVAALPVTEESGRLLGIVTEDDLVKRVAAIDRADPSNAKKTAADIMTAPVHTVEESARLAEVAELFTNHGIKHAPVVRNGILVGIVSQTDLVRDTLGEHPKTPASRPDEALRADILERLEAANPTGDLPEFTVSDGTVHFFGAPPTAKEIEIVVRAVRGTRPP